MTSKNFIQHSCWITKHLGSNIRWVIGLCLFSFLFFFISSRLTLGDNKRIWINGLEVQKYRSLLNGSFQNFVTKIFRILLHCGLWTKSIQHSYTNFLIRPRRAINCNTDSFRNYWRNYCPRLVVNWLLYLYWLLSQQSIKRVRGTRKIFVDFWLYFFLSYFIVWVRVRRGRGWKR